MTSRPEFSIFAYPCSLNQGYDVKKLVAELLRRSKLAGDESNAKKWTDCVREFVGSQVNLANEDELERALDAVASTTEKHFLDNTDMKRDCMTYYALMESVAVPRFECCRIATEYATDEHAVSCVSAIMFSAPSTSTIVLLGHGLDDQQVSALRAKLDPTNGTVDLGPGLFRMRNAWEVADRVGVCGRREEKGSAVFEKATSGSLNIFASGLLTPDLVVEALRRRDEQISAGQHNTVVLIIDSCFSGAWCDYIQVQLDANPLSNVDVILQTACSAQESSYFGALSSALAYANSGHSLSGLHDGITDAVKQSSEVAVWRGDQTPQVLYCQLGRPTKRLGDGIHEIDGRQYICGNIALGILSESALQPQSTSTMSRKWTTKIPVSNPNSMTKILDHKLKTDLGGYRMAFFIVDYGAEGVYNIHVHYDAISVVGAVAFEKLVAAPAGSQYAYDAAIPPKKDHIEVRGGKQPNLDQLTKTLWSSFYPNPGDTGPAVWNDPVYRNKPNIARQVIPRSALFDAAYGFV